MNMRRLSSLVKVIGIAVLIAVPIRIFFFSVYEVSGESMMPTLQDGNKLVVNKVGYSAENLKHEDIVIFKGIENKNLVKRIIGLPGDIVEYKKDTLYINGSKIEEHYLDSYKKNHPAPFTPDFNLSDLTGESVVPEHYIFVLGDNRQNSLDSRRFGFVKMESVIGKVNLRYYPFNEIDTHF